MKHWMALTALVMGLATSGVPQPAHATDGWKDMHVPVTVDVAIDAAGAVTGTQIVGSNALPAVVTLADQTIKPWHFSPAVVDGKAANAHTYVQLVLEGRDEGSQTQLRMRYVSHGPAVIFRTVPRYPVKAIRTRAEAVVWVAATVQGDGTYADIHIVAVKTSTGTLGNEFGESVTEMMAKARALPEQVDGHPVATQVRFPMSFNLVMDGAHSPARSLQWATFAPPGDDSLVNDDQAVSDRAIVAMNSPVKLLSEAP